jgi:uncharacterized damage-inducible protein DinB
MQSLDTFLEYWASARGRTRRVVACIPPEAVEWSHAAGRWSLGDIVRHLAGIERWMYAENAHGRPSRYPGHGRELADGAPAISAYLDRNHDDAMALFRALTPAQWDGKCTTPAGTPISTWKWLRAMVEHEAHHRGQLYLMLGMLGVRTPPIYGLTEEEVLARSREPHDQRVVG